MDLDKAFVASIVRDGKSAIHLAREKGVILDYLSDAGKVAFEFVVEYLKSYGDVPTFDIVEGKTGVALPRDVEGSSEFFTDEVLNRHLHFRLQQGLKAPIDALGSRDPRKAQEALEQLLTEIKREGIGHAKVEPLPKLGPNLLEFYDKIKAGYRGIQTPWPSLNDATLGFWPEDLILFVARVGIGKSWTAVMLANHAWDQGKRVLFITTEMAKVKIAQRWIALRLRLPYEEFRKAQLSAFVEDEMRRKVTELTTAEGLYIVGGDFDFRIESVEAAIYEAEPDIAIVDGAYLLKVQGGNRLERAANSYDELKRIAKRCQIPVVATTQFNREVKANVAASVATEKIAMTDVASWNADIIFGLIQTEDMRRDKQMVFKKLKFREGDANDVRLLWDFDQMRFEEIEGGGDAAEDYGTGLGGGSEYGAGGGDEGLPF